MRPLLRLFSLDDLWSLLGYALIIGVNRLTSRPMEFSMISVLASGMLAIVWIAGSALRARNAERHPNARVVFWGLVALVSALLAAN